MLVRLPATDDVLIIVPMKAMTVYILAFVNVYPGAVIVNYMLSLDVITLGVVAKVGKDIYSE